MQMFDASRLLGRALAAAIMLASLPHCGGDRLSSPNSAAPGERATGSARQAQQPTPPPVPMAGRWILASPNDGMCGMNFGSTPGAGEGTIAPEGGCPGKFFTSRKWTFEQGSLVIRDHTGQPLAQLAMAEPGRFEGQATSGISVSLAR